MFDAESLIRNGGLLVVFLAVFAQTGLFFCFFLPSGALMFTTGVFLASGSLHYSLFMVCVLLVIAAALGNVTGYWFGRKTGHLIHQKKDSKFFKKEYLQKAENFYTKYGAIALTAGLFFPIIRTFAPVVSGMIKMDLKKFVLFTLTGSVLWITSFVLAGYLIAMMPVLKPYLTYVILLIIVLVTIPIVIRIVNEFKKK